MAIAKISKRTVDAALKLGAAGFVWDADLKGFGLKMTVARADGAGGSPAMSRGVYVLQYRMKGGSPTKRYTIGGHGSPWTPERARERAAALLEMVRVGVDPIEKERAEADAKKRRLASASYLGFTAYADDYLATDDVRDQKRVKEVESIYARDLKPHFGDMLVTDIRKSDVNELLTKVRKRNGSAANKAHKALKTFFARAIAKETITVSPMAGLPVPAPKVGKPRDHVLSDAELRLVWDAAGELAQPFDALVRLLILTGQRLREVAGMTWAEIDADTKIWTIPGSRTKNEQTHLVPISPLAWDLLTGIAKVKSDKQLVFTTTGKTPVSGFSKTKAKLDTLVAERLAKEAGEPDVKAPLPAPWRFHDLRRTLATGCERMGVPIAVTEAILNHVSGSKRGIVGVYQRHSYADEKRSALMRWAAEIARLTGSNGDSEPHEVIDLGAARTARAAAA